MSYSVATSPTLNPTPVTASYYSWYDEYQGYTYRHWEPAECPDSRRSLAEVLWSLTATYLAALIAYGQLQYSLQGERSALKIAYKLVIFIIFPLYPACSLLAELVRTTQTWRREGMRDQKFLLSRIIGLRVTRPDGLSECLDNRHLWQYNWVPRETRRTIKIAQVLVLIFASSQCLGTLIRTSSRQYMDRPRPNMATFLPEDFESFFISIGMLAVLIKSWLAFAVNVEWKSDSESAPRSVDISTRTQRLRRMGIFTERDSHVSPTEIVSEIFLEFQTRAIVLLVLYILSWIVLGIVARRALIVFAAWACVTVLALGWLRRSEAEAVPGGKEVFVSGFCACFFFLVPRAKFYMFKIQNTGDGEAYWRPKIFPWPLIVLPVLIAARALLLHRYRLPYSSQESKLSHLGLITLGTVLFVVLPAYVLSAAIVLRPHSVYGCNVEAFPDPVWVPSF